jgi:hypothetical protein
MNNNEKCPYFVAVDNFNILKQIVGDLMNDIIIKICEEKDLVPLIETTSDEETSGMLLGVPILLAILIASGLLLLCCCLWCFCFFTKKSKRSEEDKYGISKNVELGGKSMDPSAESKKKKKRELKTAGAGPRE